MPFHSRLDPAIRPILKDGLPDGRNVLFLEPVAFVRSADMARFQIPVGATTDGASTPALLWPGIPPFGVHWLPCCLHDGAYRRYLQRLDGTVWVPAGLTRAESDALLFEAMGCFLVNPTIRALIYEGVRIGGQAAFDQDRAS